LIGTWKVTAVRIDETLPRTPAYDIDDPELLGRAVVVSRERISTTMPEGTCRNPQTTRETATIDNLIEQTMGKGKFGGNQSNKFGLPVNTKKVMEVLWVKCSEGHFGPDYPFGPKGCNWITKLSKDKAAMRWYDNSILLLKRIR
jgi:hypothetical protein